MKLWKFDQFTSTHDGNLSFAIHFLHAKYKTGFFLLLLLWFSSFSFFPHFELPVVFLHLSFILNSLFPVSAISIAFLFGTFSSICQTDLLHDHRFLPRHYQAPPLTHTLLRNPLSLPPSSVRPHHPHSCNFPSILVFPVFFVVACTDPGDIPESIT